MCEPMTIMAGISAAGALLGAGQQAKAGAAQETARRKNMREAVRQANYQDAALLIQDKQNQQAARNQMEDVSIERIQANSAVRTAIGESNLEGRTMERVVRDVDNQYLRAQVDVQRNYDTEFTNVWAERDAVRNNLIATVEGSQAAPKPSALGTVLKVGGAAVGGAIAGNDLQGAISKFSASGVPKSQIK